VTTPRRASRGAIEPPERGLAIIALGNDHLTGVELIEQRDGLGREQDL